MSEIIVTKQFETSENLDAIIARTQSEIAIQFKKYSSSDPYAFKARVKTKLFNPIVSLKSKISIQIQGDKCTIMITAETKTNVWFWLTLIGAFIPPITGWGMLLVIWMWYSQKKISKVALENALNKVAFDSSSSVSSNYHSGSYANSKMDVLEKLYKLKVAGAITDQEYQVQKSKLIA